MSAAPAEHADLALRDVLVIDGTGGPAVEADVAVTGDRITAVGPVGTIGPARHDVDGRGRVLAPGFVDVHSHDDGALLRHPDLAFKVAQGCTSVVIGNCGFSGAPARPGRREPSGLIGVDPTWRDLDGFAAAVQAAGPAVNAMALVGHNTVRDLVLGEGERAPTAVEQSTMRDLVATAVAQGACGFSTGLVYRPGRWAATDELVDLASVAADAGGIYATHIRDEGDHLLEAVDEAVTIGQRAGLPVQISHHKASGRRNWGKVAASLARIDAANEWGADVTFDVYPYTAGSGPMAHYFDAADPDPELAEVIRFASCPARPGYEGRMAIDLAAEEGVEARDIVARVLAHPEGHRTICIQFIIDEADIETNLRHPLALVGSDGIVDLDGQPHPRLFGTFPRILGHYVRRLGVLTLEDAVARMTSASCHRFGLTDRGHVAEGLLADLVLFDPGTVADTATYDDPKREPIGVDLVVVNGAITYDRGTNHRGTGDRGRSDGSSRDRFGPVGSGHTGVGAGRFRRYREAT